MLLDFKFKNFKSFYELTDFSMFADTSKREYKERLIKISDTKRAGKYILPSMVIYGANASGKTSIIEAINVLKQIIINGTVKKQIKNKAITELEICPFIHDEKKFREPIEFEITFCENEKIYSYKLGILVSFKEDKRSVAEEDLNIVEYKEKGTSIEEIKTNIFKRTENEVKLNTETKVLELLEKDASFKEDAINLEKTFSQNLDQEDLFLTTGFKALISLKIETEILNWFQEKLTTIVDFNTREPLMMFEGAKDDEKTMYTNKYINKLVKLADLGPQEIGYMKDKNTGKYSLNSVYRQKGTKGGIIIDSKEIESRGTIKLINFWVTFMEYFKKGGIFILDEFDSSIHPELVGGIIDLFNNPDVNKNHAQLIFNTHNPLYLQKRFYRRDQIMFVEKNEETYMSDIYKLSDLEVRNDVNYMKQYFEGKFGALPFIDFEEALEK